MQLEMTKLVRRFCSMRHVNSPVEALDSRWNTLLTATVLLMAMAMAGCQGLSRLSPDTSPANPLFTISGSVSPAANGTGVTVTLSGAAGATTTADSSGNYSFTGLAKGSYAVTPSKSGLSFSPASSPVTVSGANVSAVNFTAASTGSPTTYSISGTVSPAANGSGATVTLSGAASATTTANSSGNYAFTGLANGSYAVTPGKSGFSFSPASSPVSVSGASVSAVNFTAASTGSPTTYSISGTVSPAANGSGATITLSGAASATTTANSSGNYAFTGLANGSYAVTPGKSGFSFSPSSLPVSVSGANVSAVNFTAASTGSPTTYSISGTVSPAANGSGATITLSGAASATTTANSSGSYAFTGLANGSYAVTPGKSGFSFSPSSSPVTVSGANVSAVNFTAASTGSPTTYGISGTVSPAATGVTVTLRGAASATTTTNSSGNYSFTGLTNGAYAVTPNKSGLTFSPPNSSATVSGANVTGVNFSDYSGPVVIVSPGTPIQTVVAANPPGTTFVLQPGIYRLQAHIVPKTGDSFIGQTACAPPATTCPAILSGSEVIGPLATFNGTNYQVTGQTQQGEVSLSNSVCVPGYLACNLPEDLFFDGVPYQHLYANSLPAIGAGQWWFDYATHTIYFHDNPAGHTVETSVLDTAFDSLANNVTIQYLTVEEFANPLLRAGIEPTVGNASSSWSVNWVVKDCELFDNHGAGVRVVFGTQVYNSYIHNNGTIGINGTTASMTPSGIIIQGNTISNNNYANMLPASGSGGIKLGYTANAVVRGNTISNNGGAGIHFDTSSANPLVDGNIVTGNYGGNGFGFEISLQSATVRNNVFLNNALAGPVPAASAAVGSYASTGLNAYCNVVEVPNVAGTVGMIVMGSDRGYNANPPYQYLTSTGNDFHHNTVIWESGANATVGYALNDAAHQPNFFADNTPPDNNTYHLPSLSDANFVYDNNDTQDNTSKTFSEYQAAGADIHGSADTNNTSGYPTVTITSPADQSSVTGSVTIAATASDASGISKVEFYVDWNLQETVNASPYSFDWTNGSSGTHTLAAMAYSEAGIRSCHAVTVTKQ